MTEHLNEWDHRWNDNHLDSKLNTLKTEVFTLKNNMANMQNSTIIDIQGGVSAIDTRNKELEKRVDTLSTEISLLQLHTLGKITAAEMGSLLKMLKSVDVENHVVAHETINNLIKEL